MSEDITQLRRSARRAYEFGRLRSASFAAALIATSTALLGAISGARVVPWALLTFALWTLFGWRGGALLRGARWGFGAGALTFFVPLWLLRPCCRWDAAGTMQCGDPELCIAFGALLGLPLAALALGRTSSNRTEGAAGVWLGVISAATFRCSALLVGEATGLLLGVAIGALVASLIAPRPQLAR